MSEDIIKQWDNAAETFAKEQERSAFADTNKKIIKERFKKFNGERILDLGCGYGYYTDYFKSIGGNVIGTDGSKAMIDIAKKNNPDCEFMVSDISETLPFEDNSFDVVFCNQVLMDIENINNVFSECRRILKTGGTFYYSIIHPAFFNGEWMKNNEDSPAGKLITGYLTPGVSTNLFWGETKHFHRPLSHYLNGAADAGFRLIHTEEPKVYDGINKNDDIPLFFFAEYVKQDYFN